MKFTIKELNVLVRGTRLAMEETREHHEKCNTDTTRWWYEEAKQLHERIEDKLWREVLKEEDAYWSKVWGNQCGPMEPGADYLNEPLAEVEIDTKKLDYDALYVKGDIVSFFHRQGLSSTADTFQMMHRSDSGFVSLGQIDKFLQQRFSFDQVDELLEKIQDKCMGYEEVSKTV